MHTCRIKSSKSTDDDKDIIRFPISDVSEELIRPFVTRDGGKIVIPHGDEITKNTPKYMFHNHPHPFRLSLSGENNIDIDDDGDKDDLEHGRRSSELICDGCITPILQKKKISKSSSSMVQKYYYYSCDECKYFLHSACFNIPSTLPSHPLHDFHEQNLVLRTSPDLNFNNISCSICHLDMNGLFYTCTECSFFKIDIKCASLPNVIKHVSHSRHTLKLSKKYYLNSHCGVCGSEYGYGGSYTCDPDCKFSLHLGCALLPATNEHRRDKHPLPLTYDAYVNHPGEFYCEVCEKEMNPKMWMYHCRECDQSYHPNCFPASSGKYRSIKFGHEYVIATCHDPHHPLIYQLISRKGCCDLCGEYKYGHPGFQCACCNFVMCFDPCGEKHKNAVRAKH